eukprot:4837996-Alexandrium_andersonii.AAC.1
MKSGKCCTIALRPGPTGARSQATSHDRDHVSALQDVEHVLGQGRCPTERSDRSEAGPCPT